MIWNEMTSRPCLVVWCILFAEHLVGCTMDGDLCDTGTRLTIEEQTLREALIADLRAEDVQFQVGRDGHICYPNVENDAVMARLAHVNLRIDPANQFTIAGGEFSREVLRMLEDRSIAFGHSEVGDDVVVIVFNQDDMETAREIVDLVAERMFNTP